MGSVDQVDRGDALDLFGQRAELGELLTVCTLIYFQVVRSET